MLKIDVHTHIIPERMPNWAQKFGYGGFVSLDHHKPCCARMMVDDIFFREIASNCWDAPTRLHECGHHHVDVQVLSTIPVMFCYWAKAADALELSRYLNDHIAGIVAEYPKKFVGLGTVPLQDPDLAIKEMERCMSIGLKGVQIGSHVNDWNLSDEKLFPFFQEAQRLGASIFVHPWDMMGQERMKKYWLPWLVGMPAESSLALCSLIFGGVLERLPNLKVCIAHGGGSFAGTLGRIEHGFQCRPDLVAIDNSVNPREYMGKFFVDSLVHDPLALDLILKTFGQDSIVLGSDYPFPLGEEHPGLMIENFVQDGIVKKKLLQDNALNFLGMKLVDFV